MHAEVSIVKDRIRKQLVGTALAKRITIDSNRNLARDIWYATLCRPRRGVKFTGREIYKSHVALMARGERSSDALFVSRHQAILPSQDELTVCAAVEVKGRMGTGVCR